MLELLNIGHRIVSVIILIACIWASYYGYQQALTIMVFTYALYGILWFKSE